jgi:drug/metabolite transporter (DMT)-like permease
MVKKISNMKNPIFLLAFVGFTTSFVALFISAVFKRFLIPKREDTFRQTLKFSLLGCFIGMITFFTLWYFKMLETNSWEAPGIIGSIPFYFMLIGQFAGIYLTYRKKA